MIEHDSILMYEIGEVRCRTSLFLLPHAFTQNALVFDRFRQKFYFYPIIILLVDR